MSYPADKNSFDKSAKEMNIPLQMDNRDYGKPSTAKPRSIIIKSSGKDKKVYGYRTIMTKENQETVDALSEAEVDLTLLPDKVINEIKKMIKKGAVDLEQKWVNALELLHTAYRVANVRRPTPAQKGAWNQYEKLIAFSVRQLAATRGIANAGRTTDVVLKEGKQSYFIVDIPGAKSSEIEADSMHAAVESIINKLKRHGVKAKIENLNDRNALISVWMNDKKHHEINIRDMSH